MDNTYFLFVAKSLKKEQFVKIIIIKIDNQINLFLFIFSFLLFLNFLKMLFRYPEK